MSNPYAAPPDVLSVNTVAELADALGRLRRWARPGPAADPPTLRVLADRTGIPLTTIANALSGRTLPGTRVVYEFARACGLPEDDLPLWTEARQRAADSRRARRRPPAAAVTAGLPAPVTDTAAVLTVIPATVAASYLATLAPYEAGQNLTAMTEAAAVDCLAVMPTHVVLDCLTAMVPAAAARLLQAEDLVLAADQLHLLPLPVGQAVLAALPTAVASRLLFEMPRTAALGLVSGMTTAWKTALMTDPALPTALAIEVLYSTDYTWAISVLTTIDAARAGKIIASVAPDAAAGLLTGLPTARGCDLLTRTDPDRAGLILAEADPHQGATLLATLSTTTATAILAVMPQAEAGELLAAMDSGRRRHLLANTEPRRASVLRAATPSPQPARTAGPGHRDPSSRAVLSATVARLFPDHRPPSADDIGGR
ncbi:magnesium transporter MgtE N-terminal domain-containing protein [Actinoplanes xinjiangensis]|uniref:magnesium transporter MgtE N-terminal domain-containing protein n=1 Tax=Actinoplanes xinjiangensis TaxID=512350 RepID=UPI003433232A